MFSDKTCSCEWSFFKLLPNATVNTHEVCFQNSQDMVKLGLSIKIHQEFRINKLWRCISHNVIHCMLFVNVNYKGVNKIVRDVYFWNNLIFHRNQLGSILENNY